MVFIYFEFTQMIIENEIIEPRFLWNSRKVDWDSLGLKKKSLLGLSKILQRIFKIILNIFASPLFGFPIFVSSFIGCMMSEDESITSVPYNKSMKWQIVRQRIHQHLWKDGRVWNNFPGGLMTLDDYSDSLSQLPWQMQTTNSSRFTALIYTEQPNPLLPSSSGGTLLRLLKAIAKSSNVARVLTESVYLFVLFDPFNGAVNIYDPFISFYYLL